MDKDLVSILLPVYNGEAYLENALLSVQAQSYPSYELLVLDDGSTDASAAIVKRYAQDDSRIKLIINERNMGLTATLNKGLMLAQGAFIARIDADDLWSDPRKLELQVSHMHEHPGCDLVGTQATYVDQNGTVLFKTAYPTDDSGIRNLLLYKNPFVHSSVLFRTETARSLGSYLETDEAVEDYSLWLRFAQAGQVAILNTHAVTYLVNQVGISKTKRLLQIKNSFELIQKYKKFFPRYAIAWLKWNVQMLIAKVRS